ncbi:MAG TPA: cytochrome c-type biogenesis protein CcmH [Terriglobales bacterium]|nr:cytochrome c-type biogenesis protein CcmH [Terriglobales bacterium]
MRRLVPIRWLVSALRSLQLALLAVVVAFTVGASDANTRLNALGHEMMCQCGCNQVLLECNHVGCTVSEGMIAELKTAINSGAGDDQILQQFVDKYGPVVLAAPTTTGFNRVAWIMPYLVLVLGLALCVFFVRAWKHRRPALAAPAVPMPPDAAGLDEYRRRVHQETEI